MTRETKEFIVDLFDHYRESSSGKEPENAAALERAWDEVEAMDDVKDKEFLALGWKVATDSIKNCARGNQDIGALNDFFIEARVRLTAMGVSSSEIKTYE